MQKKNISISTSYEEMDNAIWDAVTEYTYELYGNDGHVQIVEDIDCLAYVISRASDCTKNKDDKKYK